MPTEERGLRQDSHRTAVPSAGLPPSVLDSVGSLEEAEIDEELETSPIETLTVLVEVLRAFTSFCKQHRLRCFLDYGSCLGL